MKAFSEVLVGFGAFFTGLSQNMIGRRRQNFYPICG